MELSDVDRVPKIYSILFFTLSLIFIFVFLPISGNIQVSIAVHWSLFKNPDLFISRAAFINIFVISILILYFIILLFFKKSDNFLKEKTKSHELSQKNKDAVNSYFKLKGIVTGFNMLLFLIMLASLFIYFTLFSLNCKIISFPIFLILLFTLFTIDIIISSKLLGYHRAELIKNIDPSLNERHPETNDDYWTWMIFYKNRADSRFWIHARLGGGYTANLAYPGLLFLTLVIIALLTILIVSF